MSYSTFPTIKHETPATRAAGTHGTTPTSNSRRTKSMRPAPKQTTPVRPTDKKDYPMTQQWPDAPTPTAQETAAVNSKPELEPCPFCSGTPVYDHDDDGWIWIECGQCGVSTMTAVHAEEDCRPILAAAWNRRAAPPADTAIEPLSDEQIEPLFRQINGMRVVGEKDEWFWFAWGVEMGERAHGIRSSGARHSAGTDRLGSDEKESDAALLREAMEALEQLWDRPPGRRRDFPADFLSWPQLLRVQAAIAKLRERLKEA
jgi:hypothetical protein